MRKRIMAFLAVILTVSLITGTIAYADNGDGAAGDRAQKKQAFLQEAAPLIQQISANREQIKALRTQLETLRVQAKEHLAGLKENTGTLTDEQIELIRGLKTQLRECRNALAATNDQMVKERQHLRAMRVSRNYEEILASYRNIIRIQEERIRLLNKMIGLNQQIIAI